MIGLQSKLSAAEIQLIEEMTRLLFEDKNNFCAPESLIVYSQGFMDDTSLLSICNEESTQKLYAPEEEFIPVKLIEVFRGYNCVPIRYDSSTNKVLVGTLDGLEALVDYSGTYDVETINVPVYYYVTLYTRYYGSPDFILPLPEKDHLTLIYEEAMRLGAAEITVVSSGKNYAVILYNVRKRIVKSNRTIPGEFVLPIAQMLAVKANATFDETISEPRYFSTRVDQHTRGRVVVVKVYDGWSITIRLLSDDYLSTTLEDLNLTKNVCDFMRNVFLSEEPGLRLYIGETFSGKNTSILSGIMELLSEDKYKIISLENPVEHRVKGLIQIDAETEELLVKNADSLLRQNPDMVYFTEITDKTAKSVLKQSNTAKAVYSTLHANSVADSIDRLVDITGVSHNRVLSTLQSCVYQKLIRDESEDSVRPVNRCVHFSEKFKQTLYGLEPYEIRKKIKEVEDSWES